MTLEEAIKHAEEAAERKEHDVEVRKKTESLGAEYCLECASEHRQLADWLKALKEIWESGDCNNCLHSKNCTIRPKLGQMVRYNCYQYESEGIE